MKMINIIRNIGYLMKGGVYNMGNFLENLFDKLMGGNRKNKRNNSGGKRNLTNMKDNHVSFGEDPGSIEGYDDGER